MKELNELGITGCGDNSCYFESPKGMATNGGCRCATYKWHIAINKYRVENVALQSRLDALECAANGVLKCYKARIYGDEGFDILMINLASLLPDKESE